jgi:predicted transcriptional regulator
VVDAFGAVVPGHASTLCTRRHLLGCAGSVDRIWSREGTTTTVREVLEDLRQERSIAYTTVMSTMDNLHRKGWLSRKRQGKAFLYWPELTREQYSARLMRDALDGGGNPGLVLSHFLEQMSDEESATLQQLASLRRDERRGLPASPSRSSPRGYWPG